MFKKFSFYLDTPLPSLLAVVVATIMVFGAWQASTGGAVRVAHADLYCAWQLITPETDLDNCASTAAGECYYCVDIPSGGGGCTPQYIDYGCPPGYTGQHTRTIGYDCSSNEINTCAPPPPASCTPGTVDLGCPAGYTGGYYRTTAADCSYTDDDQCAMTPTSCPDTFQWTACNSNGNVYYGTPDNPYGAGWNYRWTGPSCNQLIDFSSDGHAEACEIDPGGPGCCATNPNPGNCPAPTVQNLGCPSGQSGQHVLITTYSGPSCTGNTTDSNSCTPPVASCYNDDPPCADSIIDVEVVGAHQPVVPPQRIWSIQPGNIQAYNYALSQRVYVQPPNSGTTYTLYPAAVSGYTSSVTKWPAWTPGNSATLVSDGDYMKFRITFTPLPAFDYHLTNGGAPSVYPGQPTVATVNVILDAGVPQPVSLSVTSAPSGWTFSPFSVNPCSPTCSPAPTLSITTAPTTAPGTYNVVVTGSPLSNKTTSIPVTVNAPSGITVNCSVTSTLPARVGVPVTWTASASGGVPPYTYTWSGTNIPVGTNAPTGNPYTITYSTTGTKNAQASVTDAAGTVAQCPLSTGQANGGGGRVPVQVNPTIKEI